MCGRHSQMALLGRYSVRDSGLSFRTGKPQHQSYLGDMGERGGAHLRFFGNFGSTLFDDDKVLKIT